MQKPTPILVRNAILLTFGDRAGVIRDGALLIVDGTVHAVGKGFEVVPAAGGLSGLATIDARGRVVTPGLINAHMHLYSTFACGIAAPVSHNFPDILTNLWWRLDRAMNLDDCRVSAIIPAIRCLKSGVTTIIDHHASYGSTAGSLDAVARAVRGLGLRACLACEVSDRNGPGAMAESIAENVGFLRAERNDPDLAGLFGLHASFTLSDSTLSRCLDAAAGAGFHVHCAEDVADVDHARGLGFQGAADRLLRLGILGPGSIAAHCIHVTPDEVARLAESRTMVVTNPQSNMNNAVGVADVPALLQAGCTVGLGSDGMTADILDELRALILTQRQRAHDPTIMFCEAVDALTKTNPAIASAIFGRPVGVLEKGAAGDCVIWDYDPPTPLSDSNAAGHLVFGLPAGRPRTVVVSGRVLVDDGILPGVDEAAVASEGRGLAAALWERW